MHKTIVLLVFFSFLILTFGFYLYLVLHFGNLQVFAKHTLASSTIGKIGKTVFTADFVTVANTLVTDPEGSCMPTKHKELSLQL